MQWFGFSTDECVLSSAAVDLARCNTQTDLSLSKDISSPPTPVVIDPTLLEDGVEVAFTGFPLQIPLPRTARGSVAGYGSADRIDTSQLVIDKNLGREQVGARFICLMGTLSVLCSQGVPTTLTGLLSR
jgi:hypothetical protein